MKSSISKIIAYVGLGLTILFSLIFTFIEFRSLFASDFTLFNNPVVGLFSYLFRGLFFIDLIALSVFIIIYMSKEHKSYAGTLIVSGSLFVASYFTVFFYAWYIAFIIILITLIPAFICLAKYLQE